MTQSNHATLQELKDELDFQRNFRASLSHLWTLGVAIDKCADLDTCSLLFQELPPLNDGLATVRCAHCDANLGRHLRCDAAVIASQHVLLCTKSPSFQLQAKLDAANAEIEDLRGLLMNGSYVLAKKLAQVDYLEDENEDMNQCLRQVQAAIANTGTFDPIDLETTNEHECIEFLGSRLKDVKAERDELAEKVEKLEDSGVGKDLHADIRGILGATPVEGTLATCMERMMERDQAMKALSDIKRVCQFNCRYRVEHSEDRTRTPLLELLRDTLARPSDAESSLWGIVANRMKERAQAHRALVAIDDYWKTGFFSRDAVMWNQIRSAAEATK